ncbi:MAG: type II toxin-antitoxin system RelE/ParE family toxin [Alphaproteobacteria bacterium]|nr:type II toxin-antitoxin system RelE/ParE family toxin [Alphaproteobacteria bacterium]
MNAARSRAIVFLASSLADLRDFPAVARQRAGYQLDLVQAGHDPDDWKPMPAIGAGVREIRIRDVSGAFRVIYVATFAEAIFVLHCFRKTTPKTAKADLDLAARRYRTITGGHKG